MKHHRHGQSGQSLVEAAAGMLILSTILIGLMATMALLFVTTLSHQNLYELLVCQEMIPKVQDCQARAKKEFSQLPWTHLQKLEIHQSDHESTITAVLNIFDLKLHIHESVQTPLASP